METNEVASSVLGNPPDLVFNALIVLKNQKQNFMQLESELQKLDEKRKKVKQEIDEALQLGDEIEEEVMDWMKKVEELISQNLIKELEEKAKRNRFPSLSSRYQLNKEAMRYRYQVADLQRMGEFNRISYFPVRRQEVTLFEKNQQVAAAAVSNFDGYENFDSRKGVLKKIMEALRSPGINGIGVYGAPGVGKTMLVQQIKRRAKEGKLFDVVVMAKVTKNPDFKRIQAEIARDLGLELPGRVTLQGAADLINSRLTNNKVLVILDDVWAQIDLEKVGIPSGNKQPTEKKKRKISSAGEQTECIVLLASRDLGVLPPDTPTHRNVEVDQLKEEEAQELFEKIAGEQAQNHTFRPLAKEIAKKCGGLPIAIATLANTLKSKIPQKWRITLLRLSQEVNLRGMSPSLFSAIELRYGDLESKELQQILLLCSLMGHNSGLQDLLKYGIGLGLFPGAKSIEEARHKALQLVSKLIGDYSLLLKGGSNMHFDMHDPIREVAISIAAEDHGVLDLRKVAVNDRLDKNALKEFKWIYLSNVDASQLPDELKCRQLTFFHLSSKDAAPQAISDYLFRGTEGLRVLGLTKVHFKSIPQSISHLIKLHTLCLDQSMLEDLDIGSIIGELKNLQVLSLARCDIKVLPIAIGKLIRLKVLDLSNCTKLKVIPQLVLSNLSQLEELYLGNSFDQWGCIQEHQSGRNATLDELTSLEKLTTLEVHIHDIQDIPNGLFSTELKQYKIFIGDMWNNWDSSFEISKTLKLKLNPNIRLDYSVRKLLKMTEELHLDKLNGVKNVVNELDDNGFLELKHLHVKNDPEIQRMFINSMKQIRSKVFPNLQVLFLHNLMNLEKIFHGRFEETSFNKLRIITTECCNKLKNLFSFTVAKQLLNLKEIRVTDCSNIVEIVNDEGQGDDAEQEDDHNITEVTCVIELAAQLQCLRLQLLPEFISFSHEKVTSSSCQSLFNKKLAVPNLQESHLSWINNKMIGHTGLSPKSDRKWNLTKLIIEGCDKLENLFSSSIVKCLEKLEHIEIRECNRMGKIIVTEEDEEEKVNRISFKKLKFLQIEYLQNLTAFCSGNYSIEFPSLKQLAIENCQQLKGFMVDSTSTNNAVGNQALFDEKVIFPILERLTISQLKNLKIIWHKLPTNCFLSLNFLHIEDLQNLVGFCLKNSPIEFPSLKLLAIENCPELKGFVVESMSTDTTSLFDDKIVFPKLERMTISLLKNMKIIWKELAANSFCNLKSLRVKFCQNLSSIFRSDKVMLRKLLNLLENLEIIGCSSVEEVFDLPKIEEVLGQSENRESHAEIIDSGLKELYIDQLPRLKYVWNGVATFQNLESVTVFSCPKLNHLFPFSLAKSLSQLKRLEIQSCIKLKEIFAMETGGEENVCFEFPSLSCLILYSLPKLRFFYRGKHATHWKALKKFYSYRFGENKMTEEHDQLKFPVELPFLSLEKDIPELKKLSLTADQIKSISQNQYFTAGLFNQIEVLRIQGYDDQSTVPPIHFIQKFHNMQKLVVESCGFKKLFTSNSIEKLSSIRRLKLKFLPDLKHVWSQDSSVPENLETLKVWQCKSLISLSTSTSFLTLTTLDVWSCQGMINLVSFSTVQSLVLLKSLSIRECHRVTEIVGNDGHTTQDEINFKELRYLRLECLTRLTSFCPGNFTFKFPSLERVIVNRCPNLKTFCQGVIVTPILQRVQSLKRKDKWHSAGNLNGAIQKLCQEKNLKLSAEFPELIEKWEMNPQKFFSFRQLTSLEICNVGNLTYLLTPSMAMELVELMQLDVKNCEMVEQIITGGAEEVGENKLIFHQLKVITLESCSKLTSLSSGSCTLWFPTLLDVIIADCPNMVVFPSTFSRDQHDQEASEPFFSTEVEFSNLESLRLSSVNIQQRCINQLPAMSASVQNLTELVVEGCGDLKYLMTFSIVQSFSQLKTLVVRGCKRMEEVIGTEETVEEKAKMSLPLFPKLDSMVLEDLPELTRFCSELQALSATAFVFPQVTNLKFSKLSKLKSFFPQNATEWPLLTKMQLYECDQVQIFDSVLRRNGHIQLSFFHLGLVCNPFKSQQHPLFWVNKEGSFENLKTLEVSRCNGLVTLLRYTMAKRLEQLSTMSITDCSKLEEIVSCGGDKVKDEIVFNQLRSLRLVHLSRLNSFCSGNCNFKFPSLQELIVNQCPIMRIFSKGAVKTEKLENVKSKEDDHNGIWQNGNLNDTIRYLSIDQHLYGIKKESDSVVYTIIFTFLMLYFLVDIGMFAINWIIGKFLQILG